MMKRSWLQALCAALSILALAGCGGDECSNPADCVSEKGAPPAGKQYACIANKCELQNKPPTEVVCSPECGAGEVCDTSGATGVCRTCTATQGCTAPQFCDAAANDGKGVCRACTDSASGNAADQGCSTATPICDPAGNSGVGLCRACSDNQTGTTADLGCSASTPFCAPAANSGLGVCRACADTETGSNTDLGCSAASPVCDPAAASGVGACKNCLDTATGISTDLGCSDAAPICNTTASGGRGLCKVCFDSASSTGTDQGCTDTAPICDPTAGASGLCKACSDSAPGAGTDVGCGADTPICDVAVGSGVGVCKACLDSAAGSGTDQGCSGATPICDPAASGGGGACRSCLDSAAGNGTDVGCVATSPICDPAASGGAGICKVCRDTETSGSATADQGCAAPTAICDAAASGGAGICKVCLTGSNEGCPGVQTCNTEGTACEGCADDASCTNPSTPYCKATPPPPVCVECTMSSQCGATKPACDLETNFCGCETNLQCKDAPGNTDFCDPIANSGRGLCKVCTSDADCRSVDVNAPFCDAETACIQCRTTSNCAITQVCNTTNKTCEAVPGADPATTSGQIQAFLNAPVGTLTPALTIENAFVTYIKPAIGDPVSGDVGGLFLQAQHNGPAMFVETDTSTLQVGDRITLTVGEKFEFTGGKNRVARNITGLSIVSRGHPVQNLHTATPAGLAVDVSGANDLATAVDSYFGKIVRLTGTMTGAFAGAGTGHSQVNIATSVITPSTALRLRVPSAFVSQYDLVDTCTFTLDVGLMWKFTNNATPAVTTSQPSAYGIEDFSAIGCPAPKPTRARAPSATQVRLTFDRKLDAATVQAADFTIAGLTVTDATVDGYDVNLTTAAQTAAQSYTVSVDGEVKDALGKPVDAAAKTATFIGFSPPPAGPSLVINEIDADNPSTDAAEYVEIYNRGGAAADLTNVVLVLVNGDQAATEPRREYLKFPLSAVTDATGTSVTSLPAGGYILAASNAYFTSNPPPAGTLRLVISAGGTTPGQNIIQNGADGVGLVDNAAGTIIDTVFYKGADTSFIGTMFDIDTTPGTRKLNFQEGNIALARDLAVGTDSMQRFPNGSDTNDNDYDIAYTANGTPGAANQ
jgi:hypothetical protein